MSESEVNPDRQTLRQDLIEYTLLGLGLFFITFTIDYNFLLFHTITEIFSIIIAGGIFVIGWNSRKYTRSSFFLVLSISFLFVGIIDLIHTLAYKGMSIFIGYGSDLATQTWITARYIQALSILFAVLLINKKVSEARVLLISTINSIVLIFLIFDGIFPVCYVEGVGLTPFKVISEYIIVGISFISIFLLIRHKSDFNPRVLHFMVISIFCTIISELAFTLYVGVFDIQNIIGHYFKIAAFFFVYKAIIEVSLANPLGVLFRKLKKSEDSLKEQTQALKTAYSEADQIFNAAIALRIVNSDCEIIRVNDTFCDLFQIDPEEIIGKMCYEEMPHDFCHTETCSMRQIMKGKERMVYEIEHTLKNGEHLTLMVNTVAYKSPSGEFLGIIQNYTNITEKKEAEQSLLSAQKELSIKNQVANAFLSIQSDQLFPEVLDLILDVMNSEFGLFGYIDENEDFICPSLTSHVWERCEMEDKTTIFPQETWGGIWGNAMKNMESMYSNQGFKVPEGHIPIYNALDVPIVYSEELVGNILVGNKEGGYSDEDMEKLGRIANYIAPLLHDRLASKISQENLLAEKRFTETALNAQTDTFFVFEPSTGKAIRWNDAFRRASGYSNEEISNLKAPDSYYDQEDLALAAKATQEVSSKGITLVRMNLIRKDKKSIPFEYIGSNILDEEGNLKYIVSVGRNITERLKNERRIKNMISTVSHELRTPITVLLMSLDLIREKGSSITPELMTKIIETSERNISLLKELSEDLLLISQIDEKKLELDLQEYNLLDFLTDITSFFVPFGQDKNICFSIKINKNINLKGDLRRIDQIFKIIIENGLKYAHENTIIEISAEDNYIGKYNHNGVEGVLIQIKDQGIGISKDDLPHIFERFYRASNVNKTSGTGLGLSIAKELVELHDGKIYIESELDIGTSFYIFLPKL